MDVPVIRRIIQSLDDYIHAFEAVSFERQRLQLLPPRFDQDKSAGVFG